MARRWLRFNLRTLFVLLTLACVWLGWQTKLARDQKAAVAAVRSVGGSVRYTHQFSADGTFHEDAQPAAPKWLRDLVGEDYFITVCDVWFIKRVADNGFFSTGIYFDTSIEVTDDMLEPLKRLPGLRSMAIQSAKPDAGLETVGALSQLESLSYCDATDAGVVHLGRLSKLKRLSLGGHQLSDRGIAELTPLKQLESLYLTSDKITDAGLLHLEQLPALKRFELECHYKPGVSAEGMARLQQALPNAKLSARFVNDIIYPPATPPTTRKPADKSDR